MFFLILGVVILNNYILESFAVLYITCDVYISSRYAYLYNFLYYIAFSWNRQFWSQRNKNYVKKKVGFKTLEWIQLAKNDGLGTITINLSRNKCHYILRE
jgi:hypothetical protein